MRADYFSFYVFPIFVCIKTIILLTDLFLFYVFAFGPHPVLLRDYSESTVTVGLLLASLGDQMGC